MTTSPHTARRSVLRLAVAGLITLLAGLLAAVFWLVAQAGYTDNYCSRSGVPQPEPSPPFYEKGMGGRPAYMDDPFTIICEYDEHPTVEIFDPAVFIGALFLAAIVIFIGICAFQWAWVPKSHKETGDSEPA